ncbi:MAG: ATP-binding protein [Burkholderiales bacterium]
MPANVEKLISRAEKLIDKLEALIPAEAPQPDWKASIAFRWRVKNNRGFIQPVKNPHHIMLDDLCDIDEQKKRITQNTKQFVQGKPANNVLLTGARGTGKSSLIKALLNHFGKQGLRLIEVEKSHLVDLPDIVDIVSARPEKFILFCDDLSFDEGESSYKALKTVLDGSIAAQSENILIYATSNRRHLMPEYMAENLEYKHIDGEIHPGEGMEEKISLSERFGLWLSFYPFTQDEYLDIVRHWAAHFGVKKINSAELQSAALLWAIERGSRSGRVAWQFARDWAGKQK